MSETEKRTFTPKELAQILIRHADIHEGLWGMVVEFGFAAANVPVGDPGGTFLLKPTGLVSVNHIGIREYDSPNPLTVDAAEVNPRTPKQEQGERKKKAHN